MPVDPAPVEFNAAQSVLRVLSGQLAFISRVPFLEDGSQLTLAVRDIDYGAGWARLAQDVNDANRFSGADIEAYQFRDPPRGPRITLYVVVEPQGGPPPAAE